ncbi:uncharacterized protein LOC130674371 [Microplitis mediator]|uniref:uncharacterized protein LOC130674371 n=1 Tax=Microplitis mediator TaxID=375433 RepID=UPI0025566451|nr:uncharacterized protein LOC130674371 [Microplitis mediator]
MFRKLYSFIYKSFPKSRSSVLIAGVLYVAMCFGLILGTLVVFSLRPNNSSNAIHGNNTTEIGISENTESKLAMIGRFLFEHSYISTNTYCAIWGTICMMRRTHTGELHLNSFSMFLLVMISEFIVQGYYLRSWLEIDLPFIYNCIILFIAATTCSVQLYMTMTLLLHFLDQKVELRMLPRNQGTEVIVEEKFRMQISTSCPLVLQQDIEMISDESNLSKDV